MMPFEMVLSSWSTSATGIFAASALSLGPEKSDPKNDAIAIGTAKLMITARRSAKNSRRSLRTMAIIGMNDISPAGSFQ